MRMLFSKKLQETVDPFQFWSESSVNPQFYQGQVDVVDWNIDNIEFAKLLRE